MEFSPFNHIVKLCLQGMDLEDKNKPEQAKEIFLQAWKEATNDFDKFLAAHYISRNQKSVSDKLYWLEMALQYAIEAKTVAANSALPSLYSRISQCYDDSGNSDKAKETADLAIRHQNNPNDVGPFYHGTKANLQTGDFLTAGSNSNYKSELKMNHIYFTASVNGAGLAAALAGGEGNERVFIVEPTGQFENDPNLTDKKFPGNPTRSYRSEAPLRIIGEVTEWTRPSSEELQKFREKLAHNKGEIIN